jgi:membrane-bound lytic murein transglycosylase D
MRIERVTLAIFAFVLSACAVTPPPQVRPEAPPLRDRAELTSDLAAARDAIVSRSTPDRHQALADIESASSIPMPQHPSIDSAIRLFSGRMKESIQESLIRSARYKAMIDRVFAEARLPRALAYLPVIESAYLPTLTSRAGAHGMWQFMPDTAREYGLRVDWWVDERADPERSTRAAAKFIKDLYRQFNDWPLTLAAYNAGGGRVRRAMSSTASTSFWELHERTALPAETRGYVPTFFATIAIAGDPEAYGFRLVESQPRDDMRVEVEGPVSLAHIAQVASVDEDELRALNPAFRRGILPPGKSTILAPAAAAELIASQATTMRQDDAEIALCNYTLRDTDTLRQLARSIGTSVDTLLAMNDLPATADVRRGDALYLPVRARELGALLAGEQYYAVQKGDTIYSIAKKFELTVDELRDLNQLSKKRTIRAGEKLRVASPRALTAGGM